MSAAKKKTSTKKKAKVVRSQSDIKASKTFLWDKSLSRNQWLFAVVPVLAVIALGVTYYAFAGPRPGACTIDFRSDPNPRTIYGTEGPDVICAGSGNDVIYGGGGDDYIRGGNGNDIIHGGAGADRLFGDGGNNQIYGDSNGTTGVERINGGNSNDWLYAGTDGITDFNGENGVNYIYGGPGKDYVDYSCRPSTLNLTITLGGTTTGYDTATATHVGPMTDYPDNNIENVIGGMGNDTITGNDLDNALNGGPGGSDTINGGNGNDLLKDGYWETTPANCAYSPKTVLYVNNNDILSGGAGNDSVTYSERTDPLVLRADGLPGSGDVAHGESDTIMKDIEEIRGGSGADSITGNEFYNLLNGGPGADNLYANDGNLSVRDVVMSCQRQGDHVFADSSDQVKTKSC